MSAVVTADKEITLGYLNFLLFASLYFLKFPQWKRMSKLENSIKNKKEAKEETLYK